MINNNEGLTTIKLILIIMILIAICVIGVFTFGGLWKKNNKKDIKTDLLYIQAKCKVLYDKHIVDNNQSLIGEKISEYTENEEINNVIKENQNDMWYKLNQDDLNNLSADYLDANDGYIVNYESEEIIYIKGIIEEKRTYYKLSDLINNEEENIEENNEEENAENENIEDDVLDEYDEENIQ